MPEDKNIRLRFPVLQIAEPDLPSADLLNAVDGSAKMAHLKYNILVDIIGSQRIMPLYMGVLREKHNIVKYPHHASQTMINDSWINQNQVWVLLKCVEVWVLLNCAVADIFCKYSSKLLLYVFLLFSLNP